MTPGARVDVTVTFVATTDLENVFVRVVPELQTFVSVGVTKLRTVVEGVANELIITMMVPSDTPHEIVQGSIQLRAGSAKGPVIARPLPVTLEVLGASSASLVVEALDEFGDQLGPGVLVTIDGVVVGDTEADGRLITTVMPGLRTVGALLPGLAGGVTSVDLAAGEEALVEVRLTSGEAIALLRDYELVVDGLTDRVLPINFAALTMRFLTPEGGLISLTRLDDVFILEVDGTGEPLGGFADLTELFELRRDGTLAAMDVQAVRHALADFAPMVKMIVGGEGDLLRYEDGVLLEVIP